MADIPTRRPLTTDIDAKLLREAALRVDGMNWTGKFDGLESDPELVTALAERLSAVLAEVDRLTADLATTTSQRDGADAVVRHAVEKWAPSVPLNGIFLPFDDWTDDDWADSGWTPDEVAAIRRARAAQPQEGT